MNEPTTRRRLFIGLKPPAEVCARICSKLGAVLEALAEGNRREWRPYAPEEVHLTLSFLGLVDAERIPALAEALARETAGVAPVLEIAGTGTFPSPSRPRVLWAGVRGARGEGGELRRLADLAGASARAALSVEVSPVGARGASKGGREADFTPHLTLARPRKDASRPIVPAGFLELDIAEPWTPVEVVLFESRLDARSAPRIPGEPAAERYPALARFPLG